MAIFVDTSAWIALLSARDQNHAAASAVFRKERANLATSNLVLLETSILLTRRVGFPAAKRFQAESSSDPILCVIFVDEILWEDGWKEFDRFGPSGASPVDAMSFACMRDGNIKTAFSFDEDFRRAGFEVVPG